MQYGADIPFVHLLGFTLRRCEEGQSELGFEPRPEHHNSVATIHGGASMTLMDVTMAVAARSYDMSIGVVTVEMKTSFMQGARGPIVAHGQVLHRTRNLAFCEARIVDAEGRICSHATGTFRYVRKPKDEPVASD